MKLHLNGLHKSFHKYYQLVHKDKLYYFLVGALFFWWISTTAYFSATTPIGSPPDELYHIKLSKLYENPLVFFLKDNATALDLGVVSRSPNLFHLISGKLLIFTQNDEYFLRFQNLILGIVFFILGLITISIHTTDKRTRILFLFLLSNTIMLQYLFGAVSYDNLLNTFALASFFLFYNIIQRREISNFKWFMAISLIATLVKFTYIPLFISQLSIILIDYFRSKQMMILLRGVVGGRKFVYLMSLIIIVLFYFYGQNLFKFRTIIPSCAQLYSYESCQDDPGTTIKEEIYLTEPLRPNFSNIYSYSFSWIRLMLERTFGIFSHHSSLPSAEWISFLTLFSLFFTAIVFKQIDNKYDYYLFYISVFYILILFIKNYNGFLLTGINAVAVQGRYVFPILFPLIYLFSKYYIKLFRNNKLLEFLFLFIAMTLVFYFGFIYFFNFEGMFSLFRTI